MKGRLQNCQICRPGIIIDPQHDEASGAARDFYTRLRKFHNDGKSNACTLIITVQLVANDLKSARLLFLHFHLFVKFMFVDLKTLSLNACVMRYNN